MTTRMNLKESLCEFKIQNLIEMALIYQLATKGPFTISQSSLKCKIDNRIMNLFGLEYISSVIWNDYGIQLHFTFAGELDEIVSAYNDIIRVSAIIQNKNARSNDDDSCRIDMPDKCEITDGCNFVYIYKPPFPKSEKIDFEKLLAELRRFSDKPTIKSRRTEIDLAFGS